MNETVTPEYVTTWEPFTDPKKLAAEIRRIITTMPERWNQGSWWVFPEGMESSIPAETFAKSIVAGNACGSTACVAGWATLLSVPPGTQVTYFHDVKYADGTRSSPRHVGRKALGLDGTQSTWLFAAGQGKEEVLKALGFIASGQSWHPSDIDPGFSECDEDCTVCHW